MLPRLIYDLKLLYHYLAFTKMIDKTIIVTWRCFKTIFLNVMCLKDEYESFDSLEDFGNDIKRYQKIGSVNKMTDSERKPCSELQDDRFLESRTLKNRKAGH